MSNILNNLDFITKDDKQFEDFTNESIITVDKRRRSCACCTFIRAGKTIRLKFSPELLSSIGTPEAVVIKVKAGKMAVFPAKPEDFGANKISSENILYNNGLVQHVVQISGAELKEKGSTNFEKYAVQKDSDGIVHAVVEFK